MSNGRNLSTITAQEEAKKLQGIIDNQLMALLNQVQSAGERMSDRNNWDGHYADEFRAAWPQTSANLKKMQQDLSHLRLSVDKVLKDIATAGSGSISGL